MSPDGGIALMGEARADGASVTGSGTGVLGASTHGHGVEGSSVGSKGVVGTSVEFQGVYGHSEKNAGVVGESSSWVGIYGTAEHDEGVHGETKSTGRHAGVTGVSTNVDGSGPGVYGESLGSGPGVLGRSGRDAAVTGLQGDPHLQETQLPGVGSAGVFGASEAGSGVVGYARNNAAPAVVGWGGVRGVAMKHQYAGEFLGDVQVSGNVLCHDIQLTGADCAERFDLADADQVQAGDVLVIADEGVLTRSDRAYDRRVAGVVSGAGTFAPGIIMDSGNSAPDRLPVALMGKVFCKVDAAYGSVQTGDLLTTSATAGHAMRADDSAKAFGSILGKAMAPLASGTGLVPILVSLQ
jgi:hypothetical protein